MHKQILPRGHISSSLFHIKTTIKFKYGLHNFYYNKIFFTSSQTMKSLQRSDWTIPEESDSDTKTNKKETGNTDSAKQNDTKK